MLVSGQSTLPEGRVDDAKLPEGSDPERRFVIVWLSLPPLLDMATSALRSMSSRNWPQITISVDW